MKTSPLSVTKRYPSENIRKGILKGIHIMIAIALLLLACYQFKYRDLVMLKLGMSHFFTPASVGYLVYTLSGACFISSFLAICWPSRWATLPALLLFTGYIIYNSALMITTGSTCGCANVFIDIDLRYQIATAGVFALLCVISLFRRIVNLHH